MGVQGFQDFWVTGSRFYFKRNAISGVEQPLRDMGVISDAVSPAFNNEEIQLEDSDGGVKSVVDEKITKVDESYDLVLRNYSMANLAMLFMSNDPSAFTQSAAELNVTHYCIPGELLKIKDSAGVYLFGLATVAGVVTAVADLSTAVLTDIVVSTKTLTTTDDLSALGAGDFFVVQATGLTNILNSRTYTVVSATGAGPTAIVVEETPAADETTITGAVIWDDTDVGTIYGQGANTSSNDWTVYNADRGMIRFTPGTGSFATAANLEVIFSTAALTGNRLLNPQTARTIRGTGWMVWGRENNEDQTMREAEVTLTTSAANFQIDDYSEFTLTGRVISDLTSTTPAGRLLNFKQATLPTAS